MPRPKLSNINLMQLIRKLDKKVDYATFLGMKSEDLRKMYNRLKRKKRERKRPRKDVTTNT